MKIKKFICIIGIIVFICTVIPIKFVYAVDKIKGTEAYTNPNDIPKTIKKDGKMYSLQDIKSVSYSEVEYYIIDDYGLYIPPLRHSYQEGWPSSASKTITKDGFTFTVNFRFTDEYRLDITKYAAADYEYRGKTSFIHPTYGNLCTVYETPHIGYNNYVAGKTYHTASHYMKGVWEGTVYYGEYKLIDSNPVLDWVSVNNSTYSKNNTHWYKLDKNTGETNAIHISNTFHDNYLDLMHVYLNLNYSNKHVLKYFYALTDRNTHFDKCDTSYVNNSYSHTLFEAGHNQQQQTGYKLKLKKEGLYTSSVAAVNSNLQWQLPSKEENEPIDTGFTIGVDGTAPTYTSYEILEQDFDFVTFKITGLKDLQADGSNGSGISILRCYLFNDSSDSRPYIDIPSSEINSDGEVTVQVPYDPVFNNERGSYSLHVYIYDNVGNSSKVELGAVERKEYIEHKWTLVDNARYVNSNYYWFRPNEEITVRNSFESNSVLKNSYLLLSNKEDIGNNKDDFNLCINREINNLTSIEKTDDNIFSDISAYDINLDEHNSETGFKFKIKTENSFKIYSNAVTKNLTWPLEQVGEGYIWCPIDTKQYIAIDGTSPIYSDINVDRTQDKLTLTITGVKDLRSGLQSVKSTVWIDNSSVKTCEKDIVVEQIDDTTYRIVINKSDFNDYKKNYKYRIVLTDNVGLTTVITNENDEPLHMLNYNLRADQLKIYEKDTNKQVDYLVQNTDYIAEIVFTNTEIDDILENSYSVNLTINGIVSNTVKGIAIGSEETRSLKIEFNSGIENSYVNNLKAFVDCFNNIEEEDETDNVATTDVKFDFINYLGASLTQQRYISSFDNTYWYRTGDIIEARNKFTSNSAAIDKTYLILDNDLNINHSVVDNIVGVNKCDNAIFNVISSQKYAGTAYNLETLFEISINQEKDYTMYTHAISKNGIWSNPSKDENKPIDTGLKIATDGTSPIYSDVKVDRTQDTLTITVTGVKDLRSGIASVTSTVWIDDNTSKIYEKSLKVDKINDTTYRLVIKKSDFNNYKKNYKYRIVLTDNVGLTTVITNDSVINMVSLNLKAEEIKIYDPREERYVTQVISGKDYIAKVKIVNNEIDDITSEYKVKLDITNGTSVKVNGPNIKSGESKTVDIRFTAEDENLQGEVYTANVDCDNKINEEDETDNVTNTAEPYKYKVNDNKPPKLPSDDIDIKDIPIITVKFDLVAKNIDVVELATDNIVSDLISTEKYRIKLTILNNSSLNIKYLDILNKHFLNEIYYDNKLLGAIDISDIGENETLDYYEECTIQEINTDSTEVNLKGIVDSSNLVYESNENNNTVTNKKTILPLKVIDYRIIDIVYPLYEYTYPIQIIDMPIYTKAGYNVTLKCDVIGNPTEVYANMSSSNGVDFGKFEMTKVNQIAPNRAEYEFTFAVPTDIPNDTIIYSEVFAKKDSASYDYNKREKWDGATLNIGGNALEDIVIYRKY